MYRATSVDAGNQTWKHYKEGNTTSYENEKQKSAKTKTLPKIHIIEDEENCAKKAEVNNQSGNIHKMSLRKTNDKNEQKVNKPILKNVESENNSNTVETSEIRTEQNDNNEELRIQKNDKSDEIDTEWKKVTHRKRQHTIQKRPSPIKGENDNFQLAVAKKQSCLFLSGLSPNTTSEEVKTYLDGITTTETKCEKMKTRKDKYKSCFKIYVDYEKKEDVMNAKIWGKGVVVNYFLHIRRIPQMEGDRKAE